MANETERDFWNAQIAWAELHDGMDRVLGALDPMILPAVSPGMRVLEIGCGAGGTTERIAAAAGPEGRVTAVDISETLAEAARSRVPSSDIRVADAQTGDLGGPHDVVVSRLGVMFFDDPAAAFANIRRHMAPGAPLVAVAWGAPAENPWFACPGRIAAEVIGKVDPAQPGAPGPFGFADPERPAAALREAGFSQVSVERAETVLRPPGGGEGAARLLMRIGPVTRIAREHGATDEQLAEVRARTVEAFDALDGVPAVMNLIRATA